MRSDWWQLNLSSILCYDMSWISKFTLINCDLIWIAESKIEFDVSQMCFICSPRFICVRMRECCCSSKVCWWKKKVWKDFVLGEPLSLCVPLYSTNIRFEMSIKMPDNIIISLGRHAHFLQSQSKFQLFSYSLSLNANKYTAIKWNINRSEIRIFFHLQREK